MSKYLNVGIMQYAIPTTFEEGLEKIRSSVDILARGLMPPEVVFGPEMGIADGPSDTVPGKITEQLGEISKKYGIYLLAGSMREVALKDGKEVYYNTAPILGPNGEYIDKYRKICPYYPRESIEMGDKYVILDIKEKNVKIGVMICHDWCFPELSRNLTLMGAEILYRPAIDPEGLYEAFKYVPSVRALENQAYFFSINAVGERAYGHSIIAGPEGNILYEAGDKETLFTITLDMEYLKKNREYGIFFTEQLLRQVKLFDLPHPYADNIGDAPIFKTLPDADLNEAQRAEHLKKLGLNVELGSKIKK